MATKTVTKTIEQTIEVEVINCDRCGREMDEQQPGEFSATFDGVDLAYLDLCESCHARLFGLFEQMKPIRRKAKDGDAQADETPPPTPDAPETPAQDAQGTNEDPSPGLDFS